jgi:hypothetical protein
MIRCGPTPSMVRGSRAQPLNESDAAVDRTRDYGLSIWDEGEDQASLPGLPAPTDAFRASV